MSELQKRIYMTQELRQELEVIRHAKGYVLLDILKEGLALLRKMKHPHYAVLKKTAPYTMSLCINDDLLGAITAIAKRHHVRTDDVIYTAFILYNDYYKAINSN